MKESQSDAFVVDAAVMKERDTKHENTINFLTPYTSSGSKITEIATSDPNGNVYFWKI